MLGIPSVPMDSYAYANGFLDVVLLDLCMYVCISRSLPMEPYTYANGFLEVFPLVLVRIL